MNIAIGYGWYPNNPFNHLERALCELGHTVTFVGRSDAQRPGYDTVIPVGDILASLPHKTDLFLYIDSVGRYFPVGIEDLQIPTVGYLIDVHLGHWRKQAARFFDLVYIAEKEFLGSFQQAVGHDQIYWLPLCISTEVFRSLNLPRIYEVGFVGNIVRAHRRTRRTRQLQLISERFKTNDFFRNYSQHEASQIYNQSRIVFNTSISGGVTLRILEGAACGAMVLTDTRAEAMGDLFEIGRDLVTFADDNDLSEKIAYYLTHEQEREQIAEAGRQRVHSHHTYKHRAQSIIEAVTASSFKQAAPLRQANQEERMAARREVYTHMHMLDALFDAMRVAGYSPWQRLWAVLPCLVRRALM
jgi:glycosyltransferase involved in cell wall biosynthesis